MATVLVDAENVRRSLWPNLTREELVDRAAAWGDANGHDVFVVWEGATTADDDLVHLGLPWWDKAVRTLVIYVVVLALLRFAGKRQLAQVNSFDLVVLLLL